MKLDRIALDGTDVKFECLQARGDEYKAQAAVDADTKMIVATDVTNKAVD
ncbi:MAG TPA: hypothetical protein GXX40_07610 [Firmicutes bacterium]|nr:hypothetical protein [Bacillota bacterium]